MLRWIVILFAMAALPFCLFASDGFAASQGPCTDDMAKFCKDVQAGGGRVAQCMREHEKDLSPACTARIEEMKERLKASWQACTDDVQRFCKDVQPGQGRLVDCLRRQQNNLSPPCREVMARPPK